MLKAFNDTEMCVCGQKHKRMCSCDGRNLNVNSGNRFSKLPQFRLNSPKFDC